MDIKENIILMKCITTQNNQLCVSHHFIDKSITLDYTISIDNDNNKNIQNVNDINEQNKQNEPFTMKSVVWSDINKKCNDVLLSFINYSICIEKQQNVDDYIIYFVNLDNNTKSDDKNKLMEIIKNKYDSLRLSIMNDEDWREIYYVENIRKDEKRLCNILPFIKLCVEIEANKINQIYVQFLSPETK